MVTLMVDAGEIAEVLVDVDSVVLLLLLHVPNSGLHLTPQYAVVEPHQLYLQRKQQISLGVTIV